MSFWIAFFGIWAVALACFALGAESFDGSR
jgi:hypothetical protein